MTSIDLAVDLASKHMTVSRSMFEELSYDVYKLVIALLEAVIYFGFITTNAEEENPLTWGLLVTS